jgi:hypothetical protein
MSTNEYENGGDGEQASNQSVSMDDIDDLSDQQLQSLASDLVRRTAIASAMGQSFGHIDDRDYFDTLGYPGRSELTVDDYWAKFERGGIAETIITAPSGQTWSNAPDIFDDGTPEDDDQSAFEKDVESLFDDTGALYHLERADTLQRIGKYGILLIGFNDGGDLDDPVDETRFSGDPDDDILYYQPFSQKQIQDFDREDDPQNERFGKPVEYDVNFGEEHPLGSETVHHSRILHIAEGALEDEVVGHSAYRPIFNYLIDLTKVVGGSAEVYWRDAKARFVANLDDEAGARPDEDKIATQVEEMVNDLRDVVWGRNLDLDRLEGGSPDPSGLKDAILELIAGQTRIPKRRLLGTERGDLASTQDEAAFVSMIQERRQKFAEPKILRPFIDRLVEYGVLSPPDADSYDVEWSDNFELTEVEKAEVMQRKAKAYKDVASMGDPAEVATVEERRDDVLGLAHERGSEVETTPTPDDDAVDDDTGVDVDDLDETDPEVDEFFDEYFGDDAGVEKAVTDGGSER